MFSKEEAVASHDVLSAFNKQFRVLSDKIFTDRFPVVSRALKSAKKSVARVRKEAAAAKIPYRPFPVDYAANLDRQVAKNLLHVFNKLHLLLPSQQHESQH